jgi:arabinose-5-phosphate isomerase
MKDIDDVVKIIKTSSVTYFTGIGKSRNIAKHCCSLLKCININCFVLDSINALHGDIGTVKDNDTIIFFSKSGSTPELIKLINVLNLRKCTTIGICCDDNSEFKNFCTITIQLPFTNEISGDINTIPTNSCMAQLLFSNILVSKLKQIINIEKYKLNHPEGNIGKILQ